MKKGVNPREGGRESERVKRGLEIFPKLPALVPVARTGKVRHAILPPGTGEGLPSKMHGRLLAKLGVFNSAHHWENSLKFTKHLPAINCLLPYAV